MMKIVEDMHVHSRYSDGCATIQENVEQAIRRGLQKLCCVDHVRVETTWIADFVSEVRQIQKQYPSIELLCGLEAKILDEDGTLDLPEATAGADYIYAADHRLPLGGSCYSPGDIRAKIRTKVLSEAAAVDSLVTATKRAMIRRPGLVLAHLFSFLPKIGVSEESVPDTALWDLARTALATGAKLEIDERWRCPSPRTVLPFHRLGVPIFCSTDSHSLEAVGAYCYVEGVLERLHARV